MQAAAYLRQLPEPAAAGGSEAENAAAAAAGLARLAELDRRSNAAKAFMDAPGINGAHLRRALRDTDLLLDLKPRLEREFGAQHPSNAWLKIYEILGLLAARLPLAELRRAVFANAELPGSFLLGMNHYFATRLPAGPFRWVASSLLEGATRLADMYEVLRRNRQRWLPDGDNDGDLTVPERVADLARRARDRLGGGALLYTGDAGLDVGGKYDQQEALNLRLHFGQALAALLTLQPGGCAVLKHYSLYSPFSAWLAALLARRFGRLLLVKPLASRPANSELYLVGLDYRGPQPAEDAELLRLLPACRPGLQPSPPDPAFLAALAAACEPLVAAQERALAQAAAVYRGAAPPRLRREAEELWLAANPVLPLPPAARLPASGPADRARQRRHR